jgi:putative prophage lp1 protein 19
MLTAENYFSTQNQMEYFGVSQFKSFEQCESSALAEMCGEYERASTTALLVGSYVDAHFEGTLDIFKAQHPELFKKDGSLKSDYVRAESIINRIESDSLMMEYLNGEKQVIKSANLYGYDWKIKIDVYAPDKRIVDLKIVKDFEPIYDPQQGMRVPWIQYWGYDLQGAIYQRIEQLATGQTEPLPFYIVAATKEPTPDIAVIHIPQHMLDAALKAHGVEAKIDRYALIKFGDIEPDRCESCDYCKETKVLKTPMEYELYEEDN